MTDAWIVAIRVSTEEQSRPGHVSLDQQEEACRRYVEEHGGTVAEVVRYVGSGLEPAEFYANIQTAIERTRARHLVVWRLDRLGRDHIKAMLAVQDFARQEAQVHSATEPSESAFVRDLLFLLANEESRRTSGRVAANMRKQAKQGYWVSVAPFGYQVVPADDGRGKTLAPDPETAWTIPELFKMAAKGKSERELTEFARAHGLRTKHAKGKTLSRNAIRWILTNPAYAGKAVWNRWGHGKFVSKGVRPDSEIVVAEGKHPALVDQETFDAVQALMNSRRRFGTYAKAEIRMLDGIIWCAQCGHKMRGGCRRSKKQNGRRYPYRYYLCSAKHDRYACSQGYVNAAPLERQVKALLCGAVFDAIEEDASIPRTLLEQMQAEFSAGSNRLRSTLEGRLAALHRQRKGLLDDYLVGWPQADIDEKRGELDEAIAAAESELSRLQPAREEERTRATMKWLEKLAEEAERDGVYLKIARSDGTMVLGVGMSKDSIPIRFEDDVWQEVARTLIHRIEVGNGKVRLEWSATGQEIFAEPDPMSQLLGTVSRPGGRPGDG